MKSKSLSSTVIKSLSTKLTSGVVALVAYGSTLIGSALEAQQLLLHYTLNESSGNIAYDSAPNPANGTLTGAGSSWSNENLPATFVVDHFYRNSGADGTYITAWDSEKLRSLGDFSITGWLYVHEANVGQFVQDRVLSKRGASGSYYDLTFADAGNGQMALRLDLFNGTTSSQIVSDAMDMSGWFFFAVTRNSTTGAIEFYYGTPDGTFISAGGGNGVTGIVGNNNSQFMIGNVAANTARAPKADFSDIRVYGSALNASEIQGIMNSALIPEANAIFGGVAVFAIVLLIRRRISACN